MIEIPVDGKNLMRQVAEHQGWTDEDPGPDAHVSVSVGVHKNETPRVRVSHFDNSMSLRIGGVYGVMIAGSTEAMKPFLNRLRIGIDAALYEVDQAAEAEDRGGDQLDREFPKDAA